MSRECDICGKKPLKANNVSFSNKHHGYHQKPNLQTMKTSFGGSGATKKIKICTSCLKAEKARRAF